MVIHYELVSDYEVLIIIHVSEEAEWLMRALELSNYFNCTTRAEVIFFRAVAAPAKALYMHRGTKGHRHLRIGTPFLLGFLAP